MKIIVLIFVFCIFITNAFGKDNANWLDVMNNNGKSAIKDCPKFQILENKWQNLKKKIALNQGKIQKLKEELMELENEARSQTTTKCNCNI